EAVDADQGPEHLDDDRGIVPLEDQRDEDQHGADQVEERKTPVSGRQPALLIREIRRDKDRRTGKPDDVVWLDIAPHRRLPAAAANPVKIPSAVRRPRGIIERILVGAKGEQRRWRGDCVPYCPLWPAWGWRR